MMASDENNEEIDLYDNMEENWKFNENMTESYDNAAVDNSELTGASKDSTNGTNGGRKVATYVGNLRWWTTDVDLLQAVKKLGINDVAEIKFHENRQNGQSKGFCVMVFLSDKSAKCAMENLPKTEIHGMAPIVTYCTKQNLNYFESAAGGNSTGVKNKMDQQSKPSGGMNVPGTATPTYGGTLNSNMNYGGSSMRMNSGGMQQPPISGNNMQNFSQNLLMTLQQLQTSMTRNPGPNMMSMMMQNNNALMAAGSMTSGGGNSGSNSMGMNASRMMTTPTNVLMPQSSNIPMTGTGPTPHINPSFFNSNQAANLLQNSLGNVPSVSNSSSNSIAQFDTFGRQIPGSLQMSPKISETEFEDILQRNKTVSSGAITRAVQDASSGDYASAIETLVTAISLIRQSKIANDNRCKVLINSLQDTLVGIESKSYGTRKTRNRRRSYSESSNSDRDNIEYTAPTSNRRVIRSRSPRSDRKRRSRDYGNNNTGSSGSRNQPSNAQFYDNGAIGSRHSGGNAPTNTNSSVRYRH